MAEVWTPPKQSDTVSMHVVNGCMRLRKCRVAEHSTFVMHFVRSSFCVTSPASATGARMKMSAEVNLTSRHQCWLVNFTSRKAA